MNRRRLIFTVLGALGATAIAPVAQVVESVAVSGRQRALLATGCSIRSPAAVVPPVIAKVVSAGGWTGPIPRAELFISVSADVSHAVARLDALMLKLWADPLLVKPKYEQAIRRIMIRDELSKVLADEPRPSYTMGDS